MRIITIDDHPLILAATRQLIGDFPGAQLVGQASTIAELKQLLATVPCDILITDYAFPREATTDGLALLQGIRRKYPLLKLIVLTMLDNAAVIRAISDAGITAVVSKRDPLNHILLALQRVANGLQYMSPSVQLLLEEGHHGAAGTGLSTRELEVLRLFASGMSMTEVAEKINRSVKTASAHKVSAMRKLGAKNDSELHAALRELRLQ